MDKVKIYCLNYKNNQRKLDMTRRFDIVNLECKFFDGVDFADKRISNNAHSKRAWSCMYGHLDMIYDFYYNTNKEFGIFCEDDIYIHKNFAKYLPRICSDFNELNLDVLLLGYLLQNKANENSDCPLKVLPLSCSPFTYHSFPDYVWGTQMYMLSRKQSKFLLDKYYKSGYAERTIEEKDLTPFSADWTLTKEGNRAIINPMLIVEDNQSEYDHQGQEIFHKNCFAAHFQENLFIQ